MQSMRLTRVLLAVCLTAAALSACGGNDDPAAPSNPPTPGNPSTPAQPVEKRCAP